MVIGRAWVAHLSGRAAPLQVHLAEAAALLAADDSIALSGWRGDVETLALGTLMPIEQNPEEALRRAERAASLTPPDHRFAAGLAHSYVNFAMQAMGRREEAIRRQTERAEREAERIDAGSIRALLGLMFMHRQAGNLDRCANVAAHTLTLCERHDLPVTAGWARLSRLGRLRTG